MRKIPPGLLEDIAKRKVSIWKCPHCGAEVPELQKGLHVYRKHREIMHERTEAIYRAVKERPGQAAGVYWEILDIPAKELNRELRSLVKSGRIRREGDFPYFTYFPSDESKGSSGTLRLFNEAVETIPVIESVDGNLYTFRDGTLYRVVLEKVGE